MTDQDKKQFALMMGGMSAAFRCDSNKETMAIYFQYLIDFSVEAVRYAVDQSIKTADRFPTVSKLREYANAYRPPVNRTAIVPEFCIEEFSGEEMEKYKSMTADDFFKEMESKFGEV